MIRNGTVLSSRFFVKRNTLFEYQKMNLRCKFHKHIHTMNEQFLNALPTEKILVFLWKDSQLNLSLCSTIRQNYINQHCNIEKLLQLQMTMQKRVLYYFYCNAISDWERWNAIKNCVFKKLEPKLSHIYATKAAW